MKKIAITGTIASGKSFILSILENKGFKTFSSDKAVKAILENDNEIRNYLTNYDPEIINEYGDIDKKLLAKYIFEDSEFSKEYKEKIYEAVAKARQKYINENLGEEYIFFEIPLLFEKNLQNQFDKIILADASQEDVEIRLKERQIGKDIVEKMINEQIANSKKVHLCDYVINTSRPKGEIEKEIMRVIENERDSIRH